MPVFDLGGVVARFHPGRRLSALAAITGLTEADVQARVFDSGFEQQAELGHYTATTVLTALESLLDYHGPHAELVEAWSLAFEPDADVLAQVASLSTRRALLTNNGPMLDACLAGPLHALIQAFDTAICSWHLGARKPDRLAFERAAERLEAPPSRLLLLDDSAANVASAIEAGWQAAQVRDASDVRIALAAHILA